jgi:hypothetical protein
MYQSIVSLKSSNVSLPQFTKPELLVAELTNANTAEVIDFLNKTSDSHGNDARLHS